ncbi:hypothetical protein UFOVP222_89 [uncultured Caudovirales phage]|uniref:Uncharacterized protein n=1 Tax=uncultured Caudovirales phage TaxID=2100421 RepID=A0A6J7WP50_9CAUD|nr:hypothetical protein UFOVP108_84 [uncultured Caudovirales phage]CAB5219560.1 hypothetical protein UFOVP222_89 [uncultured Caudovirales phage]
MIIKTSLKRLIHIWYGHSTALVKITRLLMDLKLIQVAVDVGQLTVGGLEKKAG